jgi:hypothetical protein
MLRRSVAHVYESNLVGVGLEDGEEHLAVRAVAGGKGLVEINGQNQRADQRGALVCSFGHEILMELWGYRDNSPQN